MRKLGYIIGVILIIGWAVGYFAFHFGAAIHTLLVIALVIMLLRFIEDRKSG